MSPKRIFITSRLNCVPVSQNKIQRRVFTELSWDSAQNDYLRKHTENTQRTLSLRCEKLWMLHCQDLSNILPTQRLHRVNMIIFLLSQGEFNCTSLQPTIFTPPCVQILCAQGYLQQHCTKRKEDTAWFRKVMKIALAAQQNGTLSVMKQRRLSDLRPTAIKSFGKIHSFFQQMVNPWGSEFKLTSWAIIN